MEHCRSHPWATPIVIRVKHYGDDSNDGSTWQLAKRTIKNALNAASDAGSGNVWVKGSPGGIVDDCPLTARPFVYLYGGFDEADDDVLNRDWASNSTIIRADGDIITIKGILTDGLLSTDSRLPGEREAYTQSGLQAP